MQRRMSQLGRYAVPAACALALGACFHQTPQEAPVPSGNYGGTVVAYPVGGYAYDPYLGYYGYEPYGTPYLMPYAYGYPGYAYAAPRVVVPAPVYRYSRPSESTPIARGGQYGLHPWTGKPRTGQLKPPPRGFPAPRASTGRIAHPRPPAPPAPRPTVSRKPSVPAPRVAAPRPAPQPRQRPEWRH